MHPNNLPAVAQPKTKSAACLSPRIKRVKQMLEDVLRNLAASITDRHANCGR